MTVRGEHPMDRAGCAWFIVRFAACSSILYILMFLAIFLVALVGVVFFR